MQQWIGLIAPRVALVALATSIVSPATAQQLGAEAEAAGILAVQLRQQDYRCDAPVHAELDAVRSRADEQAWTVRCANASYRMRLMPDMAAAVERLN
jgi:hypothetical protein